MDGTTLTILLFFGFDLVMFCVTWLLLKRNMVKGAERAKKLIVKDKQYIETQQAIITLKDNTEAVRLEASATREDTGTWFKVLEEKIKKVSEDIPTVNLTPVYEKIDSINIPEIPELPEVDLEPLKTMITNMEERLETKIRSMNIPTLDNISERVSNTMKGIDGAEAKELNREFGKEIAVVMADEEVQKVEYDLYFKKFTDMGVPEKAADLVAYRIAKANPKQKKVILKKAKSSLDQYMPGGAFLSGLL